MIKKELGKISSVNFGRRLGPNNDMFGIEFTLSINETSFCDNLHYFFTHAIYPSSTTRANFMSTLCLYIDKLLYDAKVDDVYELKGKPVEITTNDNCFVDFRILIDVL